MASWRGWPRTSSEVMTGRRRAYSRVRAGRGRAASTLAPNGALKASARPGKGRLIVHPQSKHCSSSTELHCWHRIFAGFPGMVSSTSWLPQSGGETTPRASWFRRRLSELHLPAPAIEIAKARPKCPMARLTHQSYFPDEMNSVVSTIER